ncbi:Fatty acid oxidation complex subunit alpha [Candidatus Lokiarchaeum ossiferum]|uniref:Fatty acid oxidation complex subunit alpha n=1 Tax=Candidatus Lokiarchaeum ossiferum TaxID=2951803 RepID=A0ABY6HUN5_9ARCH|nr:Fatty acid oxidation complex subunit alpha [Candidatus Lokiarchaeum sp. B-35]
MTEEEIIVENDQNEETRIQLKIKSKIAYITINTKMNTINIDVAKLLVKRLREAEENPKVSCVVLKSEGESVFSAGFDLALFANGLNQEVVDNILSHGREISRTIFFMKKPVIAQIQGKTIGLGCIIALSCDFRFVANKPDIFFQLPEIDLKIFPATGPTAMSLHVLGPVHAKEMLLTGKKVPLEQFDRWGGVTELVEPELLGKTVKKFARSLTQKPTELLHLVKPAINIMAYNKAKDWYDMENEMARHYFDGFFENPRDEIDAFIDKMWKKYGFGRP